MRKKIYVVLLNPGRKIIRIETGVSILGAVIGPFKTVRAAKYCVDFPHAQYTTVKEFERAEAVYRCQTELIQGNLVHLNRRIFYKTELDKTIG